MSEPRLYKKPPIDEALCDFQFSPGPEWDPTMPGRIHEKLKGFYNEKPKSQQIFEAQLQGIDQDGGAGIAIQQRVTKQRVQLLAERGTRIASLGAEQLTVHMLAPYTGWETFRSKIVDALEAYCDVAEPEGVTRVGLRYINRIAIPGESEPELADYFTVPPKFPEAGPNIKRISFFNRKEAEFTDLPIRIVITFAQIDATGPAVAADPHQYLLDLDIIWLQREEPMAVENCMRMVDQMKVRHRTMFESLIKDKARHLFNA